jgi:lysophospholipase L1-like esterase
VTKRVIAAMKQIAVRVRAQEKRVYGATITPFGGNAYDDPAGTREVSRQAINKWIRMSGVFDAVVDFDVTVRDAKNASRLDAAYDSGDGLHLNPAGYKRMAETVDLRLLP